MKTIKLTKTDVTHLMCIGCGGFGAELAIAPDASDDGPEPQAGVHKKCAKAMHVKKSVSS
jgi:hypothetical protein